ncbi:MurPQ operon repressor [Alloiococcus otitis]|uniref:SIS domain-containing protein n=1 Tax=Alloiococcus otitis ATCC 51267 TaxID=883081 RepID=K9ERV6_9LACT|nr:MurR/RpiR family transcriptional regulator [Alloiococcus otitis]EKU93702.1 hypothetical protein HMPREF9698_00819 [Alloiococcus otitis ATCC 51267]SUU80298.1 MurPQ operon repressor [Alloiococcus otitis]
MFKPDKYELNLVSTIEGLYESFTPNEKKLAKYFLKQPGHDCLSSRQVADQVQVSESSLSRFAQKCGYSGYREFIYHYKAAINRQDLDQKNTDLSHLVVDTYQDILAKSFSMVDVAQIKRICKYIKAADLIYVYGLGNSAACADEFKFRFMRFGCPVLSESNHHTMKIQAASMNPSHLLVGITISAKTREVMEALQVAKGRGAKTVLITSNNDQTFQDFCDEVLLVAVKKHLDEGRLISPQFPVLIMLDLLFAYYYQDNNATYNQTIAPFKDLQD